MYRTRILRRYGWPYKANIYRKKRKIGKIIVGREALVFIPKNKKYVTKIQYSNEFSLPEMKYLHAQKVKDNVLRLMVMEGGTEKEVHKIRLLPFEGFYYAEPKKPLYRLLRSPKSKKEIPKTIGVLIQKKVTGKLYNPTGPELFRIPNKFKIMDVHIDNLIKKKNTVYIVDFLPEEQHKEKRVRETIPKDYRMGFLRRLIKKR